MLKSLFGISVASFCSTNIFQVIAVVFVLTELLTGAVVDNVVYIVLYPAYGDIYETSVPCVITYLLPTKAFRRLIFIFYIPVFYLWLTGRKSPRQQSLCDGYEVTDEDGVDLQQSETLPVEQKQIFSCSSRRFQKILVRLRENCSNSSHCRCILSYLWSSYQLFLPAGDCIRWLWNGTCWKIVCRPFGARESANDPFRKLALRDVDQLHENGGLWKDFCRLSTFLPFAKWRHRSLSWGELIHSRDERYQTVLRSYSKRLRFYRLLPLKTASRLWGRFNQLQLPIWLRSPTFHLYIRVFGCCLEDALVQDLTKYRNLSEFFQRKLIPGIRPIHNSSAIVSPVDGTVLYFGVVKKGVLEQVKGVIYSLKGFLGPVEEMLSCISSSVAEVNPVKFSIEEDCETKFSIHSYLDTVGLDDLNYYQSLLTDSSNHLYQCIIYLAPGDYHRFHSPADWTVYCRRHFPGELFSVNPGFARWLQGLFNFNERAVYVGRWQHGFFSMAAVGATNVGSINVHFDKTLSTNVQSVWDKGCFYDAFFIDKQQHGVKLQKGEDFGTFNLGSTIVLLFEAPPTFQFEIDVGQKIKFGKGIGSHCRDVL